MFSGTTGSGFHSTGAVGWSPLEKALPGITLAGGGPRSRLFSLNDDILNIEPRKQPDAPDPKASVGTLVKTPKTAPRPCRRCPQPAKSGYSLWVGNLPPRATLHDLCWLFGTPEIQSVYLIHRTGCAFVNYATAAGLQEAEQAFLRRDGRIREHKLVIKAQRDDQQSENASSQAEQTAADASWSPDRYFICKSLTVADLDAARSTGQWSTQIHNRNKLNEAFWASRNCYLVFSANRTSAFHGVARMVMPFPDGEGAPELMADDNSDVSGSSSADESISGDDSLEIHPTPAFTNPIDSLATPAGRTVHDTTRGCLFWEAEGCPHESVEPEQWTPPCRIEWLTPPRTQVSFGRTKHLRNPLNNDKPVKIARDGTEIEPTIGRKLLSMFRNDWE